MSFTFAQFWSGDRIPAGGHFGDPRDGGTRKHRGTDYTHGTGTPIPSPVAGRVTGKLAPAITHGFGYQVTVTAANGTVYSFAHMNSASPLAIGAVVSVGQLLGYEGHTGATTGPCVHVEVRDGGVYRDPAPYIRILTQTGTAGGGATPITPTSREIEVKSYHNEDKTARGGGRAVEAGGGFYLNTVAGAPVSNASNVVGGIGTYSITPHIYFTGEPGDSLDLVLIWQATQRKPATNSAHYIEHLVIGDDGKVQASREFKRGVASGDAVYVRVDAPATNKAPVEVTLLDCDAFLFIAS